MMTFRALLIASISIVFLISCATQKGSSKSGASLDQSWAGKMRGLSSEVKGLVPYVYSRTHYSNPANRELIKDRLSKFKTSVHMVPKEQGKALMGDDPLVRFSLSQLSSDIGRAREAFEIGRVEYSRGVLKSAMNHCFRCHSAGNVGPKAKWTISNFKGLQIDPAELADLKVATRDFKGARQSLRTAVVNFDYAESKPFEYETVLKKYLALSLRMQLQDEERAQVLKTFDRVADSNRVPAHLRGYIQNWNDSLKVWKKAKKRPKPSEKTIRQAVSLLGKGKDRQSYFKDHSGDVEFLTASSLLHGALKSAKSESQKAQAYLYLGETYEVLDELGYWGLHEIYYESCVRAQPKSKLGKTCFERLRNSLYLGYTGSAGTHLPLTERQRLKELEKMTR